MPEDTGPSRAKRSGPPTYAGSLRGVNNKRAAYIRRLAARNKEYQGVPGVSTPRDPVQRASKRGSGRLGIRTL